MFCSKCGAEKKDGSKFCTVCGAPIQGNNKEVAKKNFIYANSLFLSKINVIAAGAVILFLALKLIPSIGFSIMYQFNQLQYFFTEVENYILIALAIAIYINIKNSIMPIFASIAVVYYSYNYGRFLNNIYNFQSKIYNVLFLIAIFVFLIFAIVNVASAEKLITNKKTISYFFFVPGVLLFIGMIINGFPNQYSIVYIFKNLISFNIFSVFMNVIGLLSSIVNVLMFIAIGRWMTADFK